MFGHQFFPTPIPVIEKMIAPYKNERNRYNFHDKYILEPSAGKGDILNFITGQTITHIEKDYHRPGFDYEHKSDSLVNSGNCYCFEIDFNLQSILEDKGYNILGDDFLQFTNTQEYWFDLVLMNPPFDTGCKHLLHAWDVITSGDIVCLLNEETIKNPYTSERQLLLKIIEDNGGSIEYLGNCFSDAENKTDVNVALIRLSKKHTSDFEFDFETKEYEEFSLEEEEFIKQLQKPDLIEDMRLRYKDILRTYKDAYKAINVFRNHLHIITSADLKLEFSNPKQEYLRLSKAINSKLWRIIISKLNIQKFMTHEVRSNFEQFIVQKGLYEFNHKNIQDLITMIFENSSSILEKAVIAVFDLFTKYHSENRCHIEGWKTNDSWKVNRKIILPNWIRYGEYMNSHDLKQYGDKLKINYVKQSEFSDIDKVMCYISGIDYNKLSGDLYSTLYRKLQYIGNIKTGDKFDGEFSSHFFHCKVFRKGTLHITFKDEFLWQEFNMRACAGKNWLPPSEKEAWENSKKPKKEAEKPIVKTKALSAPETTNQFLFIFN